MSSLSPCSKDLTQPFQWETLHPSFTLRVAGSEASLSPQDDPDLTPSLRLSSTPVTVQIPEPFPAPDPGSQPDLHRVPIVLSLRTETCSSTKSLIDRSWRARNQPSTQIFDSCGANSMHL